MVSGPGSQSLLFGGGAYQIICFRNTLTFRIICGMKWTCHWYLALKSGVLLLLFFQTKATVANWLVGPIVLRTLIYSLTDVGARPAAMGFNKDASQGMRSEEWNQLEFSPFICCYSCMVACSYRIAGGEWLQTPADIKAQDPETRGGDRWVACHRNLMGGFPF